MKPIYENILYIFNQYNKEILKQQTSIGYNLSSM